MTTQQQRSEETRSRLLQAAESCFAQSGYDRTSVATICQAAGVSKGAFYHHFSSKQEIFLELLNRWITGMNAQLLTLSDDSANIPDRLLSMTAMLEIVRGSVGESFPIYLEFWTQASRDPEMWQATSEPYRRYRDFFAGMISAGIDEGSLRPVDPKTGASIIVALAVGLLVQGLFDPEGADWENVSEQGMKVLLEGLKASRPTKEEGNP